MIRSLFVSVTPNIMWILWSSSLLVSFLPLGFPSLLDVKDSAGSEQILRQRRQQGSGRPGLLGRIRNLRERIEREANRQKQNTTKPNQQTRNNQNQNGRNQSQNSGTVPSGQLPPLEQGPNGLRLKNNGSSSIAFPSPNRQVGYQTTLRSGSSYPQRNPLQQGGQLQQGQPLVAPSNQIISQEAIIGDQFNIGHIVFRLTPADYRRWLTRSIFVNDVQGRLMYPAVVPSFMDKLESKFNDNLFKEPRDVHIWFVFGGRQPITVTIHGASKHQVVLTPQAVRRLRSRRFVQSWWRNFNEMLQSQAKSSDYPPLIQAYLGCLVQQRVGLTPPAGSDQNNKKPSPMMQTWELLTASENMQVSYLREMMCGGGQDVQPATQPLPANIRWQEPAIPPVDPNTKVEPIAFVVPEECFYVRFGNWGNQIWLKNLMQEHGGDLSRMVRLRGYQSLVGDLFRDQLAMQSSSLDDLLGGQVIEDVAVVGFDTFFSEGAAAGIILQSKGNTLATSLSGKRKAFAKKHEGLGVRLQKLKIDGTDATLLQSPDGRVRSYYVHIGGFHCVTTSYALAVRFLETTKGVRSLGMSPEFRYARNQMPLDREDTIFAYLSTKFLQNVLSPHYQIEMRRRLRSITEVQTLQMATWSAQSEGQQPPAGFGDWESVPIDYRIAQLVARGYLPKSFNRRPDGSKIGLLQDTSHQWALAKTKRKSRNHSAQSGSGKKTLGTKNTGKTGSPKKKSSLLGSFFNSIDSGKKAQDSKTKPKKDPKKSTDKTKENRKKPSTGSGSIIPLIGPGSKKSNQPSAMTLPSSNKKMEPIHYTSTRTIASLSNKPVAGRQSSTKQTAAGGQQRTDPQERDRGTQRPLRRRLGNLIRNVIEDIENGNRQNSGQTAPGSLPPLRHNPNQLPTGQVQPRPIGPGWSIAPNPKHAPNSNIAPGQLRLPGIGTPRPLTTPGFNQGFLSGQDRGFPTIQENHPMIKELEDNPVGRYLYGDTLRGVRGWMLPIADTSIRAVTEEEARWYASQASYFESEWKKADPIMIGIKRFRFKEKVERVVFDGRIAPFGGESLSWITDNIGKPMEVVPVKNPDDVIRFQASIQGGSIFPGIGPHQLLAAVQRDARQLHSVDPGEWWTTFKLIKDTPGYIASWPTAGMLDYLPMLGGQPDAEGFTHSIGRQIWRLQHNGFSVIAMDKNRLRKMKPFLQVEPAKRPAQVRLEVSDLANSQLADWANTLWKQRSWQSSVANVRLLHLLMQYFHLPPDQAKQKAQSLLNAKLVCSLGGTYQLVGPTNRGVAGNPGGVNDISFLQTDYIWQSSHWPIRSQVSAGQIPGGKSPLLKWFRGALFEVSHKDNRFLIHGYLDIQRKESEPAALPSFNLFKGFQF